VFSNGQLETNITTIIFVKILGFEVDKQTNHMQKLKWHYQVTLIVMPLRKKYIS